MKVVAAWLALLAVLVAAEPAERQQRRRGFTTETPDLEPPRPQHLSFIGEPSSTAINHNLTPRSTDLPTNGKTQHVSESKKTPENAEEVKKTIKCVKIDRKPSVKLEDVFKGRFKRETMSCFKCEDLKKGGTYEKCTYGSDPGNKAYFESHQKSYSSKDKPKDSAPANKPSAEYLQAAASIGKYSYDDFGHFTPDIEPKSTEYHFSSTKKEPTKSYSYETTDKPISYSYKTDTAPEEAYKYGRSEAAFDKKPSGEKEYSSKPSEYSYKTTKVEPNRSYSYETTDKPISYSYRTSSSSDSEKPEERDDASSDYNYKRTKSEPKQEEPTEYNYKRTKSEPKQVSPSEYSYRNTNSEPKQEEPSDYNYRRTKSEPKNEAPSEYSYRSTKVEPKRSYSYETTDKPVSYSYSSKDEPAHEYGQSNVETQKSKPKSYSRQSEPEEYSYSKTVTDPLKTYHESSSYGDEPKNKKKSSRGEEYSSRASEPSKTYVSEPSAELKRALGEFHQKDRSHCEKVQKELMTCWVCKDKSGVQQEECMYVASSQPKVTRRAYSDLKQTGGEQVEEPQTSEVHKVTQPRHSRRQTPAPVVEELPSDRPAPRQQTRTSPISPYRAAARQEARLGLAAYRHYPEASQVAPARVRTSEQEEEQEKPARKEPKFEKPKEFEQTEKPEEGAFSDETREVYDKKLGFALPAYMLEQSAHEKYFDEAVKAGRR